MTIAPFAPRSGAMVLRQTARIRRFEDSDIPQVAAVHQAAFRLAKAPSLASYRDYFSRVFLENPAADGSVSSLVYEQRDGRIAGFVGLVPRRVTMNGRQYQAAISSQFIVDPATQVGLVALRLAKAYLEGPQDLSIADEANDVSQKLWEGLGGTTSRLLSIHWTRPLRPAQLATSCLRERRGLAPFAVAARPFAAVADLLATRMPGSQFRQSSPSRASEQFSARTVMAYGRQFCAASDLRVEYDEPTLQWLLDRAANRTIGGRMLTAVVKDGAKILGWYVAHLDGDGVADVAQLVAGSASIHDVLDHLFHEAWKQGAVSVTGRLDARFMQALSDKYCFFHRRGPWVLFKAKHPELRHAFEAGATCFSRLDGEWSLRYQPVTH